jgi:hypothetical protein
MVLKGDIAAASSNLPTLIGYFHGRRHTLRYASDHRWWTIWYFTPLTPALVSIIAASCVFKLLRICAF